MDECALGIDKCDKVRATCKNVHGGTYTCKCNSGYTGDGTQCQPCTNCPQQLPQLQLTTIASTKATFKPCTSSNMYQCPSDGTCIDVKYVLDGKIDCKNGEDEGIVIGGIYVCVVVYANVFVEYMYVHVVFVK